jgi:hypothetical protein
VGVLLPTDLYVTKGTLMDKLELYNLALSLFDREIDDLTTSCKELQLLNLNYNKTVTFCMKAWEFPFLIKLATLTEYEKDSDDNPVTWNGFKYGYTVPDDFGYAIRIDTDKRHPYTYRFGRLWTKRESPELEYMPSELSFDEDGNYEAPDDFLALVAYQLALHIAPMLDPEGTAQSVAAQMFQLTFTSITENEIRSNDRPSNYDASEYWDNEMDFHPGMLRDLIINGDI